MYPVKSRKYKLVQMLNIWKEKVPVFIGFNAIGFALTYQRVVK